MQSKQSVTNASENEKQAIRDMVHQWLEASKQGDTSTVLNLMADDVLFITPDKEPFGKEAFAATNEQMKDIEMETDIDIKEIEIAGEWAWMRSFLNLTITPAGKEPTKRSGHILTILEKQPDGRWVIKRDANFVKPENQS